MPLYEYACTRCRAHFEVRQRITDDPVTVCPTCGGPTRRVLHPVGIIFKGSGFYITDSRRSESRASASTDSGESTSASAKGTDQPSGSSAADASSEPS
ncbi:MAG: zinc ribbon domain-containing protein [Chloroflexi bacterium]|nr:zinc ribbon domain-containing protein [Chloroflexota bacterium]